MKKIFFFLFFLLLILLLRANAFADNSLPEINLNKKNSEVGVKVVLYEHRSFNVEFEKIIKSCKPLSYQEYCMINFPFYVTINEIRKNIKRRTSIDIKTSEFYGKLSLFYPGGKIYWTKNSVIELKSEYPEVKLIFSIKF